MTKQYLLKCVLLMTLNLNVFAGATGEVSESNLKTMTAGPSREILCKEIVNNYECAKRIESYWISRLKNWVYRNGGELTLTLSTGQTIVRADTPGEFEGYYDSSEKPNQNFTFSAHLEREGYYLLEIHYYEGNAFQLISNQTGFTADLPSRPQFSPDFKRFLVVSSEDYDEKTIRIEIWTNSGPRINKEWSYKPRNWPWILTNWVDPLTIEVYKLEWPRKGGKGKYREWRGKLLAIIYNKNGVWTVSDKSK
jgi:hypothetical protein